jgi:hypothetical protein
VRSDKDLALNWDEPRSRALRDAYVVSGGAAQSRKRRWQRHDVLSALYRLADGKADAVVDLADLVAAARMPQGQVYNAIDSLEQDGAVRSFNGNCVMLLAGGVSMAEGAMTKPYRAVGDLSSLVARGRPGLVATMPGAATDDPRRA